MIKTFLIALFLGASVLAQDLTPMAFLAKASQSIRGHQLKTEEIADSSKKNLGDPQVIQAIIQDFLSSEAHANKMMFRLEELFLLSNSKNVLSVQNKNFYRRNSLNDLFFRMAQENLSWDELLTGKSYQIYPRNMALTSLELGGFITDHGFLSGVYSFPFASVDGLYQGHFSDDINQLSPFRVDFKKDDPRIAGSITTSRFFERYGATAANKNRRRAAAVFRIFMCDSMSAQVSASDDRTKEVLDLMYPSSSNQVTEEELIRRHTDPHGAQKDCMSCHYKLDPMGQTFSGSALVIAPVPVSGMLQFKNKSNQIISIPAKGIGDIANSIIQQEEYLSCQTGYFWKWFIGSDVPLSAERHQEINNAFNRVNRKTNDFIAYLLTQPEFSTRNVPDPDISRAVYVKNYLQRCDSCHSQKTTDNPDTGGKIPSFTAWPILGKDVNFGDSPYWIAKIAEYLDLNASNIGHNRKMPPPPDRGGWIPSRRDLQIIKKWIDNGAKDLNGARMIP